jgi:hypothetical protein
MGEHDGLHDAAVSREPGSKARPLTQAISIPTSTTSSLPPSPRGSLATMIVLAETERRPNQQVLLPRGSDGPALGGSEREHCPAVFAQHCQQLLVAAGQFRRAG